MPARPDISILLITDREIVRADVSLGGEPRVRDVWQAPRPVEGALATAAELAMTLGPKIGRRVLVLTTSVWTQIIALPAASIENVQGDELEQTLKFEVESFSGMAAFESQLTHVETAPSGDREFWIAQLASGDLLSIHEVVEARGARLVGVAHPAGLPVSLTDDGPWRRLEFWPGTICCVAGGQGFRLFLAHSDPHSDRWPAMLQSWQSRNPGQVNQWLVGPGVSVGAEHLGEPTLRLEDRPALEQWLAGWAAQIKSPSNVPLLRPARRPMARRTKVLCSLALLAAALAGCGAHWWSLELSKRQMSDELATLKKPTTKREFAKQAADLAKQETDLTKQLSEVDQVLRSVEPMIAIQRLRTAALLNALARRSSNDLVIRGIKPSEQGVTISGLSLVADGATRLADGLNRDLQDAGWRTRPPDQTGTNQLTNGGPWNFVIVMEELPPPPVQSDPGVDAADGRVATFKRPLIRPTKLAN